MGQLRRFLHLERRRSAAVTGAPDDAAELGRFEALEAPAPAAGADAAPTPAGAMDRFRAPPERALELDAADPDEQPFRRCCRCETDSGRFAPRCGTCGADLHTEEQRVFNERLWAARRAEAAEHEAANAARREEAARAGAQVAETRLEAARQLARAVGEQERARLDAEGLGDDAPAVPGGRALGLRVLEQIPGPGWRVALVVIFVMGLMAEVGRGIAERSVLRLLGVAVAIAVTCFPFRPRMGS